MKVLEIENLTKKYGRITAINGLNLSVQEGQVFGILGPNGSGKTTTLGCVLGITKPDLGQFSWFGNRYGTNSLRHVGALLETPNFYPYLNALDNLKIVAHIKKAQSIDYEHILTLVNLWHRKDAPFRTYSLGMKQRLAIASTMVGDPDLLIFDEPTNGLDPTGIAEVRNTIQHIAAQGKTILMASHILDEVEKVCTDVAIIKNGNLLAQGTVGGILTKDTRVEIAAADLTLLRGVLQGANFIKKIETDNGRLVASIQDNFSAFDLSRLAFENGIILTHLAEKKRRLEDEFLAITANA